MNNFTVHIGKFHIFKDLCKYYQVFISPSGACFKLAKDNSLQPIDRKDFEIVE